jgi:hypothetical protein
MDSPRGPLERLVGRIASDGARCPAAALAFPRCRLGSRAKRKRPVLRAEDCDAASEEFLWVALKPWERTEAEASRPSRESCRLAHCAATAQSNGFAEV